jgi:hypothetical protein
MTKRKAGTKKTSQRARMLTRRRAAASRDLVTRFEFPQGMPSYQPDRWLVSVLVKARLPLDFDSWYQFGRSIGDHCTGGMSGGIVPNAHYTVTLVLPPETQNPAQVATTLVERAAAQGPSSRYGIRVVDGPFTERFSDHTQT